jgi:hypothetical protein
MLKVATIVAACSLAVASLAHAEEPPQPYEIGGGWRTCPMNFLIYHGRCLPAMEGPITEYGCEVRQNGAGEVLAQTCPGSRMAIVGNVGLPGAPLQGFTGYGVGPSFVSGVGTVAIGVTTLVGPHAGRR